MARNKNKRRGDQPTNPEASAAVAIQGSVLQNIRLHARSEPQREICGVLLGNQSNGQTRVVASIKGQGANQGDAHVTFTQETWNKIHEEKDKKYPNEKIVGWYHSHPGFGVFLSDHDLFIHKNFFSQPGQLAWVFDPHSDEEGCFGWENDEVRRIKHIGVVSDAEHEPLGGTEPAVIPEQKGHASKRAEETSFFGEFTRDLLLIGSGLLLGVVVTWFSGPRSISANELVTLLERLGYVGVQTSDGRRGWMSTIPNDPLLQNGRTTPLLRQTEPSSQIAPGQDQSNPLKERLMNPAEPDEQEAGLWERLISSFKSEKSSSADDASQQTGEGDEQSK
jgi:proteasome lid subunit RPN8/RPN11